MLLTRFSSILRNNMVYSVGLNRRSVCYQCFPADFHIIRDFVLAIDYQAIIRFVDVYGISLRVDAATSTHLRRSVASYPAILPYRRCFPSHANVVLLVRHRSVYVLVSNHCCIFDVISQRHTCDIRLQDISSYAFPICHNCEYGK